MNLWRKFEEVVKPWVMVLIFILLLLWGLSKEANAGETSVELGPTFLSGELSKSAALVLNETWDDRWRVGLGLIGPQEVVDRSGTKYDVRSNLFVHGQRLVGITENLDFGVGVAYFNAKTRWNGSNFVASLSVEYNMGDRWQLLYRHWSNAGSASPNMGQDVFLVGYKFGR